MQHIFPGRGKKIFLPPTWLRAWCTVLYPPLCLLKFLNHEKDVTSTNVVSVCFPGCVHSDRSTPFVSRGTRSFLTTRGISSSTSTPYHPQWNNQCELSNQTIWRTTNLLLHSKHLSDEDWEAVLPEALHAVCSLVCLSTNETPHECFFRFFPQSHDWFRTPFMVTAPWTCTFAPPRSQQR